MKGTAYRRSSVVLRYPRSGERKALRELGAARRAQQDKDRSEGLLPVVRPVRRGDCEPCVECQKWRDRVQAGGSAPPPACGHTPDESIARSRPCLFVTCRHNPYADVSRTGGLQLNFPEQEPGDRPVDQSCSLDLVAMGRTTLYAAAEALNVTRQRIQQMEETFLRILRNDPEVQRMAREHLLPQRYQGQPAPVEELEPGDGQRLRAALDAHFPDRRRVPQ